MQRTAHNLPKRPTARRAGFTLIELLVVIGIIVLLVSLVLAVGGSVSRSSEERATKNTLEILNAATEEFERVLDRRVTYRSGLVTGGIAADPTTGAVWDIDSNPFATGLPPGAANAQLGINAWTQLQQPYSTLPPNGLPAYSLQPFRRTATLLWVMSQSQTVAPILQKLPESVFRSVRSNFASQQPSLLRHCVDSWDTPIIAIFPGREATQAELDANNANVVDRDGTVRSDSEWAAANLGGLRVSCKDRRILWVSAGIDTRFSDVPASGVSNPSADNIYSYQP